MGLLSLYNISKEQTKRMNKFGNIKYYLLVCSCLCIVWRLVFFSCVLSFFLLFPFTILCGGKIAYARIYTINNVYILVRLKRKWITILSRKKNCYEYTRQKHCIYLLYTLWTVI